MLMTAWPTRSPEVALSGGVWRGAVKNEAWVDEEGDSMAR